jgi:hypothetical protein
MKALFSESFLMLLEKIVKRLIWIASDILGRKEITTVSSKARAISYKHSYAVSSFKTKIES